MIVLPPLMLKAGGDMVGEAEKRRINGVEEKKIYLISFAVAYILLRWHSVWRML